PRLAVPGSRAQATYAVSGEVDRLDPDLVPRSVARPRLDLRDRVDDVHPPVTQPKTVCFPLSQGHESAVTMKNCEPFVFGPAFAIASTPRSTSWSFCSSSNW